MTEKSTLSSAKTIIVKIGSNALADQAKGINHQHIQNLVKGIVYLKEQGKDVLLVSSGSIGCGRMISDFTKKQISIPEKQALSSIGQIQLMAAYAELFAKHGHIASQVLVSHHSLNNRNQYHNLNNCLAQLLKMGAIPIINENDTLSTDELSIGDNDTMAALLCTRIGADALVLLTVADGVLDDQGETIPLWYVKNIKNPGIGIFKSTSMGTGGIVSKLEAAKLAASNGTHVYIANATVKGILEHLCDKAELGTQIPVCGSKLKGKKKWLLATTPRASASIVVDSGAHKAIAESGKSLLPAGIKEVIGDFPIGAAINIVDTKGKKIATGLVNYDAKDLKLIAGKQSKDIRKLVPNNTYNEAIHRNNMVVFH